LKFAVLFNKNMPRVGVLLLVVVAALESTWALRLGPPPPPHSSHQGVDRRVFVAGAIAWTTTPRRATAAVDEADAAQIRASVATLRELTTQFDAVAQLKLGTALDDSFDGDAVRRRLGFVGTSSPLYRIESTLRRAVDAADTEDADLVELRIDFGRALQAANDLAYSAIFSDPSGNAGRRGQRGRDYLARSKISAEEALAILEELADALDVVVGGDPS